MSWKGTTKVFGRLPQRVLTKTRIRSETKDYQFDDVYSQFNELTKKTEKFHSDAIKFRDNLTESLNHQVNVAEILITLYNPIQGSEGGVVTRRQKTPVKSMKAVEEYEALATETRDLILPELDTLDVIVISPAKEFLNIIKTIKKTISKRDHKKTDYDRFKTNLKKLQDKKEKSSSEEKQMFKLEEQFSRATQEYDHYNDLLKEELPIFFEYRSEFIEPVFETFYNIQLNIFTILLERLEQLIDNTGEYFDIETDIIEGYERKRVEVDPKIELLTVIKRGGKNASSSTSKISSSNSKLNVPPSHESIRSRSPNYLNTDDASSSYSSRSPRTRSPRSRSPRSRSPRPVGNNSFRVKKGYDYEEEEEREEEEREEEEEYEEEQDYEESPPAYTPIPMPSPPMIKPKPNVNTPIIKPKPNMNTPIIMPKPKIKPILNTPVIRPKPNINNDNNNNNNNNNIQKSRPLAPPPPVPITAPKPKIVRNYVIALYDYDAQAEGDLSFKKDDKIEVIERTQNINDWWKGRLDGTIGVFPGNYVAEP
ncbi:hypothetical protein Glove_517g2 [Diversispora epigaea]|uniref:SH3 domain-containing protein n=1 Tax=Diversispora epigaea TaxID=1348612 RepID=A0A397GGW3_9GLOM|nr:hypothetical protein Glove_517g2 [Diversispora epigaea]